MTEPPGQIQATPEPLSASYIPPCLKWRLHRYLILLFVFVGIHVYVTTFPCLWTWIGLDPRLKFVGYVVYGPLLGMLIIWYTRGDRATKRRIADGELPCWHCGYDLQHTASPGTCPECGRHFEAVETRAAWQACITGPKTS
jgi:hypothetical protein